MATDQPCGKDRSAGLTAMDYYLLVVHIMAIVGFISVWQALRRWFTQTEAVAQKPTMRSTDDATQTDVTSHKFVAEAASGSDAEITARSRAGPSSMRSRTRFGDDREDKLFTEIVMKKCDHSSMARLLESRGLGSSGTRKTLAWRLARNDPRATGPQIRYIRGLLERNPWLDFDVTDVATVAAASRWIDFANSPTRLSWSGT